MNRHGFKAGPYGQIETKRLFRLFCFFISLLVISSGFTQSVYAHKVNIFAYAEDGKIHAEAYFVDGSKCKNSLVEVIDEQSGRKLLEGHTDNNGKFIFDIPGMTSIRLILQAGTGHQNEYVISEGEVREAMPNTEAKQKTEQPLKQAEKMSKEKHKTVPESNPEQREKSAGIQHELDTMHTIPYDINAAIERAMDKKLQPVMRILLTLQEKSEKPGITEILGGIGYIIGILGIIAYFKARSQRT